MGLELQQNLAVASAARWPTWYQRDLQHRLEVGARRRAARGMIARFDAIEQLAASSMAARRINAADQPATGRRGPAMRLERLVVHKVRKRFDGLKRPTFRSASAP
jgi:hypothetical protein